MQKSLYIFKAERYLLQGIRYLQNHCNGQRSVGCGLSLRPTPTYVQDRPRRRATTSEVATGVLGSGMSGISCCNTAIWKPTAEILCSQSHGLSLNTVKAGNHAESLLQNILTLQSLAYQQENSPKRVEIQLLLQLSFPHLVEHF